MGRMQVMRRGELLAQLEPGPTLTATTRETLLPLVATLLLEVVATPVMVTEVTEARETEGSDEQDRGLPQNLWVGAVGMARGWCPSAASSDPGGCACAHRGQGASLRSAPASRGTALTAAPRTRPVGSCPTTPEQRPCGVVDDRRESGRPSIPFPVPIGRIPFRNPRQSALQNIQASRKGTGCNSRLC